MKAVKHLDKNNGQIEIFGSILYTEAHATVIKVLNDDIYWNALGKISGVRWCIFSIRAFMGTLELPMYESGRFGYLAPIYKEPKENEELLKEFGIQGTQELPLFVVFIYNENDVRKLTIKIKDDSNETVFNSIKDTVVMITEIVNAVDPKYYKNKNEVFNLVVSEVERRNEVKALKLVPKILLAIKELLF